MLFTPALAYYFKSVHATNMNGFSSGSTPVPGAWDVFVYQSVDPRRKSVASSRVIRSEFVDAVKYLGKHLYTLEHGEQGQAVLNHIRTKDLTAEESALFALFFDIVDDGQRDQNKKAKAISIADYKRAPQQGHRLNV